jgi:hypothetical protein
MKESASAFRTSEHFRSESAPSYQPSSHIPISDFGFAYLAFGSGDPTLIRIRYTVVLAPERRRESQSSNEGGGGVHGAV